MSMDTAAKYTTPEEDKMIDDAFRDLLDGYMASNHRKKVEIIERAFAFATEAHKGIRRRSGEPYILHPIAVAKIAQQEIGLGSTSICAALLHDVVEDTEYTVEDIEHHFGPKSRRSSRASQRSRAENSVTRLRPRPKTSANCC